MATEGSIGYRLQRVGDMIVMTFIDTSTHRTVEMLRTLESAAILAANLRTVATGPDALDADLVNLTAQQPEAGEG